MCEDLEQINELSHGPYNRYLQWTQNNSELELRHRFKGQGATKRQRVSPRTFGFAKNMFFPSNSDTNDDILLH